MYNLTTVRHSLTGCSSSSSARDRSLAVRPQVLPSSCLSSLPALISLQHLCSTPLCRPVKLQGSRCWFTSLFMKEIPRHILWLSLPVCSSGCAFIIYTLVAFQNGTSSIYDAYKQVRSSASQMLRFLNHVLFMCVAALCATQHVHTRGFLPHLRFRVSEGGLNVKSVLQLWL